MEDEDEIGDYEDGGGYCEAVFIGCFRARPSGYLQPIRARELMDLTAAFSCCKKRSRIMIECGAASPFCRWIGRLVEVRSILSSTIAMMVVKECRTISAFC